MNKQICHNALWGTLQQGQKSRLHPYHTFVLGYHDTESKQCKQATVVLRGVDPEHGHISFHTNIHSQKIPHLSNNISALFYDTVNKRQLCLQGRGTVHHQDEVSAERWLQAQAMSKVCYHQALPPLTPLNQTHQPPLDEAAAYDQFAVVSIKAVRIDILDLHVKGNQRWVGQLTNGSWQYQAVWA